MYPTFNAAATEAAIRGTGVLFSTKWFVGIIWWEGDTYFVKRLQWVL